MSSLEATQSSVEEKGLNPNKLVSTEWLAEHLNDENLVLIESNEDPLLYSQGHIPGAYEVDWTRDLNDPLRRDYLQAEAFSALLSRMGYTPDSTVVLYGDKNNWWATYALWVFELFGVTNTRILDGGRIKWQKDGRAFTRDIPAAKNSGYVALNRDDSTVRAFRDDVLKHIEKSGKLIDVRSPEEFNGTRLHMEAYPNEGALRGGHIPGAKSVPWAKAINAEDGTFKSLEELKAIYEGEAGLDSGSETVVYCRIGERSSHTWFVLKYLLGYENVRNYDGSWTEWGNLVGVPIER
jgi:thiosulfate/3-mercaptopyruvate sulfurtransferase